MNAVHPPCITNWLSPSQRGNAQPQGNTGPYGGDVKPKVSNNPYGGGAKQASNPYGGVIIFYAHPGYFACPSARFDGTGCWETMSIVDVNSPSVG